MAFEAKINVTRVQHVHSGVKIEKGAFNRVQLSAPAIF